MDSETGKGKPLSKDEVKALLHLIERSKIITNKTTNATTNKLKLDEWKRITTIFNATASICWRSPRQLRLKWENLKKNSRKRSINIKTNQSSNGAKHYIPPDDVLDRVAKLLSNPVSMVHKEFDEHTSGSEGCIHVNNCNGSGDEFVTGDVRVQNGDQILGLPDESQQNGEIMQIWRKQNQYSPVQDNWQVAKNRALAEYYTKKKDYLDVKMEHILLENIKLKLEIEKLKEGNQSIKAEPL